jgi:hypothetical protein
MPASIILRQAGGMARVHMAIADEPVVAYLTEAAWVAHFGPGFDDTSFEALLLANRDLIEAAITRKVASVRHRQVVLGPDDL